MKIYKIDENSWRQQDVRTSRPQTAMYQGIHNLTADNISNKTPEEQAAIEAKYIANERQYQLEKDIENNKYSSNIENKTKIGSVNEHDKKTAHIDPTVGEYIENSMSTVASASGGSADVADSDCDCCYEMSVPGTNKTLYIYTKKQHNEMAGGLIVPEDETNTANVVSNDSDIQTGAGVSFADDANASGVSFADDTNASGIAFNNKQLDEALNNLENSKGGAIPAIVGELALQLIPQIPGIISAIKSKRDDTKVGKGLSNAMTDNKLIASLYSNLPSGRSASFYNDMIKEFNSLKRTGSGIQVRDGEYFGTGRVTEGLKKFFNFVKKGYNDHKEIFSPIRDALLNAITGTITSGVNKATDKLTDTVRNKTQNEHLRNIADAVSTVGKSVGKEVNKQIEASVLA